MMPVDEHQTRTFIYCVPIHKLTENQYEIDVLIEVLRRDGDGNVAQRLIVNDL